MLAGAIGTSNGTISRPMAISPRSSGAISSRASDAVVSLAWPSASSPLFLMRPIGGALFGHVGDCFAASGRAAGALGGTYDHRDRGHRPAADLCRHRPGSPLPAPGPAPAPGPVGGRRIRHLHRLPRGAQRPAAARSARQRRLHGRLLRHPAGLGRGVLVASLLDPAALQAWGWRIPFLLGIALGGTVFILRRVMVDDALPAPHKGDRMPLAEAFRTEWPAMLRGILLCASFAASFYLVFVYMATYMQQADGPYRPPGAPDQHPRHCAVASRPALFCRSVRQDRAQAGLGGRDARNRRCCRCRSSC